VVAECPSPQAQVHQEEEGDGQEQEIQVLEGAWPTMWQVQLHQDQQDHCAAGLFNANTVPHCA
jgi:hypothetical protein